MLSLIFSALLPLYTYAAPLDLLALKPEQVTGTVQRTEMGSTEFQAGLFGVAAIYHKLSFGGKSFDMKASFARTRGSDGVGFVIPVGKQKVALVLGGWSGRFDGFNRVNGLDPSNSQNPTRRASKVVNGNDLELLISVRQSKISVLIDGMPHIELDASSHKLSVVDDIQKRFEDGIGLYIVNGGLDITSWTIEEKL